MELREALARFEGLHDMIYGCNMVKLSTACTVLKDEVNKITAERNAALKRVEELETNSDAQDDVIGQLESENSELKKKVEEKYSRIIEMAQENTRLKFELHTIESKKAVSREELIKLIFENVEIIMPGVPREIAYAIKTDKAANAILASNKEI